MLSVAVSAIGVFVFLLAVYRLLTNVDGLTLREVLPGAIAATIVLEATFQVLPLYVRFAEPEPDAARARRPAMLLLVWLYVMANVIVLGAEVNWWAPRRARVGSARRRRRSAVRRAAPAPRGRGASERPSTRPRARRRSASRPRGTKTGS